MIEFALFGAGRIGKIHAANLARQPGAKLTYVIDRHAPSAEALARTHGAQVADVERALGDASVQAVVIASSTDTHADLIVAPRTRARRCSARNRSTSPSNARVHARTSCGAPA